MKPSRDIRTLGSIAKCSDQMLDKQDFFDLTFF
jgi:hypothetical protein